MTARRKTPAASDEETPTQRGARKIIDLWAQTNFGRKNLGVYTLDPNIRRRRTPRNLLAETIEALPESERVGAVWIFSEIIVVLISGYEVDAAYLEKVAAHIPEETPAPRMLPSRRPLARQ